jgi:hypothetical protein
MHLSKMVRHPDHPGQTERTSAADSPGTPKRCLSQKNRSKTKLLTAPALVVKDRSTHIGDNQMKSLIVQLVNLLILVLGVIADAGARGR